MTRFRFALMILLACAVGLASASVTVRAQQQFQFIIAASDAQGNPVSDLTTDDILMSENGMPNTIAKVEPFRRPVQLTLAVDNGVASREMLSAYRTGLEGLVKALPEDVEVTLITTAPQPRRVVQASTNREELLRGINQFGPENAAPRFSDTLVEFAKRYEDEFNEKKIMDSIPVLVMVSTTANESQSYQPEEINRALLYLRGRRALIDVAVVSTRGDVTSVSQINENMQALIGIPAVKNTGGHYEALAISTRIATLLPEWGAEIAALHTKYNNQWLVTVERAAGLTGGLQNPQVGLTRDGLDGEVSLDGMPPLAPVEN